MPNEEKPIEPEIVSEEVHAIEAERSLAIVEKSYLDQLAMLEDGEQRIARRSKMLEALKLAAIRATDPQNWVMNRDREGKIVAYPDATAGAVLGDFYGVEMYDVFPRDAETKAPKPQREELEGGVVRYSMTCAARSGVTKRDVPIIKASRRSDEKFVGRETAEVGEADLELATITLLRKKAALTVSGCARVPVETLDRAWATCAEKSTAGCVRGHGFGSGKDRTAKGVATPEVVKAAKELGEDIMRRVEGDKAAAADLLEKATEFTNNQGKKIPGIRSIDRFTSIARVNIAKKNVKEDETWGDEALAEQH